MDVNLPLDQMSTAEKLRAMEALWADLSRNEEQLESPGWHGQILQERHEQEISGNATSVDWDSAKQQLRERLK